MTIPPAPDGFTRFVMKSRFGMGRDFAILDPQTEQELYYVDGAAVSLKPTADVRRGGKDGELLYRTTGRLASIPKRMTISNADGVELAELRAKAFSLVKDKMTLTVAGEDDWTLTGSLIEKDYSIDRAGEHIVQITQKWVTIRDTYTVDVGEGVDPGLAFAIVWAVDRWVERD